MIHTDNILGVRLPLLSKVASRQLSKESWREYLQTAKEDSFKETISFILECRE